MIEKIKTAINKRINIIATDGLNPLSDIEEIASAKYRIDGLKNALSIIEAIEEENKQEPVKVSGYVARDADEDLLCWFSDKPVPSKEMPGCWLVPHPLTNWVKLPKEAYPDLRPEHGPIKVDLILQRNEH